MSSWPSPQVTRIAEDGELASLARSELDITGVGASRDFLLDLELLDLQSVNAVGRYDREGECARRPLTRSAAGSNANRRATTSISLGRVLSVRRRHTSSARCRRAATATSRPTSRQSFESEHCVTPRACNAEQGRCPARKVPNRPEFDSMRCTLEARKIQALIQKDEAKMAELYSVGW